MKKLLLPLIALAFSFVIWSAPAAADAPGSIDLTNWNRTLPVDSKQGTSGEAVEIAATGSFPMCVKADGSPAPCVPLVFKAPTNGAHTSGSKYARDENREMNGTAKAAWTLKQGGTMTATLTVDAVPALKDGTAGKEVIGQIHGKDNELVRLYWDAGRVYFHNDLSGSDGKEHEFKILDAAGKEPAIALGEAFSYLIDAHADTLTVKIWADGDTFTYTGKILPVWQTDALYFKAGVYLGENFSQGATGFGQVSFHLLDFSHTPGMGLAGLPPPPLPPAHVRTVSDVAADMQKLVNELQTMH